VELVVVFYGSAERVLEHFGENIFKVYRYVARW
jgi:hypothetical protein